MNAFFSNDKYSKVKENVQLQVASIAETVVNGFLTVDLYWTVTAWNKAAEQLLGIQTKAIIGKNLWEALVTIIPPSVYSRYSNAPLEDIPFHFQGYWKELGLFLDVITFYYTDTLSVSFKSSLGASPAAPKNKFEILNELYRFITEVTNDCLWEWNIQNRELFWIDGGHKRVFGYDIVNTLVTQRFWEHCLHPDDRMRVTDKLYGIFATGISDTWEDEYRFKKLDGGYAYVHDRGHLIYEQGKVVRMIGATQDITARKQTEIKLFESERKLSLIAKQTVNAVIITDNMENIQWVNEAFSRITEYSAEEVIGRKPGSFLHGPETDPVIVEYLKQQMIRQERFECEIINYTKSGHKYWIHMQGQPIFNDKGNCESFFAIETDISERKFFETDKIAKQQELTEAVLTAQEQERSDIGQELHDNVNQILTATKLYIEMAKGAKQKKTVYLDEASLHLANSIEELRRISSRLVPPGLSIIGLSDSIRILMEDLSKVHPVSITYQGDEIDNNAIDEKMQLNVFRIVQEQVNNILKHSGASKAIILLKKTKKELMLSITDNGKGCDVKMQKKGVGIRNIQSRIELYHGTFAIESKPKEGYTLKVVLPLIIND